MAGSVTAGMCLALQRLGLIDSFDVLYGTSAGAINAALTGAGQMEAGLGIYSRAASQGLIDVRRAFAGEPMFRVSEIVEAVIRTYPPDDLDRAIPVRVTAARVADKGLAVLGGFTSIDELRCALWASCAIPLLAGDVVEFRGERYVDGALLESIPYRVALSEGATHVLVLRSRHAWYRKPDLRRWQRQGLDRLLRGVPQNVREMVDERPLRYNAEVCDLQHTGATALAGRVTQLCPNVAARRVSQFERDPSRLAQAVELGTRTVVDAIYPAAGAAVPVAA